MLIERQLRMHYEEGPGSSNSVQPPKNASTHNCSIRVMLMLIG
jgi:hypothetical protein